MRLLTIVLTSCVSALSAQSPLATTFAGTNPAAGMVVFDLNVTNPAGIQIFAFDINTSQTSGSIDCYTAPTTWVGNQSNPSAWTYVGLGSFAGGTGVGLTQVCLGGGFYLPPGQYGFALAQGPATTQNCTTAAPLVYSTADLTLTAGASSNNIFAGVSVNPCVWNGCIHYNVGPVPGPVGPGCAPVCKPCVATTFGAGCGTPPLALSSITCPVLGTVAQALISNQPTPIAGISLGWSNSIPGLPLNLGFLGMPGCFLLHSNNVLLPVTPLTPSTSRLDLVIPNAPNFLCVHIYLQAWCYAPLANNAQIIVSNGLDWTIGNL